MRCVPPVLASTSACAAAATETQTGIRSAGGRQPQHGGAPAVVTTRGMRAGSVLMRVVCCSSPVDVARPQDGGALRAQGMVLHGSGANAAAGRRKGAGRGSRVQSAGMRTSKSTTSLHSSVGGTPSKRRARPASATSGAARNPGLLRKSLPKGVGVAGARHVYDERNTVPFGEPAVELEPQHDAGLPPPSGARAGRKKGAPDKPPAIPRLMSASASVPRFYKVPDPTGGMAAVPVGGGGHHGRSFRSDVLNLEVALSERLRRIEAAAEDGYTPNMEVERFRVFHHLFNAIIEKDFAFGPLLRRVKDEYDGALMRGAAHARAAEATSPGGTPLTGDATIDGLRSMITSLTAEAERMSERYDRLLAENSALKGGTGESFDHSHADSTTETSEAAELREKVARLEAENERLQAALQAKSRDEQASSLAGGFDARSAASAGPVSTGAAVGGGDGASAAQTESSDGGGFGFGSDSDSDGSDSCGSLGLATPRPPPKNKFVPALSLGAVTGDGRPPGYMDEFMANKEEWSESWREEAKDMPTVQDDQ